MDRKEHRVDWFYVNMALGFAVGFWNFVGPLHAQQQKMEVYCIFIVVSWIFLETKDFAVRKYLQCVVYIIEAVFSMGLFPMKYVCNLGLSNIMNPINQRT